MAKAIKAGSVADTFTVTAKNSESSTLAAGTPVMLAFNGTDDGVAVVLPASASQAKARDLFLGVTLQSMASGVVAPILAYGFARTTILTKNTRAATTDTWSTQAAWAVGDALVVDTVNNAFARGTLPTTGAMTIVTGATTDTITANFGNGYRCPGVIAQSVASMAGSASATSDTRTVITAAVKTFIRGL